MKILAASTAATSPTYLHAGYISASINRSLYPQVITKTTITVYPLDSNNTAPQTVRVL